MPPLPPAPGPLSGARVQVAVLAVAGDGPTTGDVMPPAPPLPGGTSPSPAPGPTPAPAPSPVPTPAPPPGRLGTDDVAAALAGWTLDARAVQVRQSLDAGDRLAGTTVTVRGGAEIRSSGDLTVLPHWSLPGASTEPAAAGDTRAGGVALTLRAAGDVTLAGGLGSGFEPPPGAADLARWAPLGERAGSLRVEAGRDLRLGTAANATTTVRSTTGRVELQAGRDLVWAGSGVSVYTSGLGHAVEAFDPVAFGQSVGLTDYDAGYLSPFLTGGGSVVLQAGRDLLGAPAAGFSPQDNQLPSDWAWRIDSGLEGLWWSRLDRFAGGVASFGGGDLHVGAGGSLVNLYAATAGSGRIGRLDGTVQVFEGGSMQLQAGDSLLGGSLWATGPVLDLRVGGRIGPSNAAPTTPDLVYQNTDLTLQARGEIALRRLQSFGWVQNVADNGGEAGAQAFTGLDAQATLSLASAAGGIHLAGQANVGLARELPSRLSDAGASLPGRTQLLAPLGDITLDGLLVQRPADQGALQVLAGGELSVQRLAVSAAGPGAGPALQTPFEAVEQARLDLRSRTLADGTLALDASARSPVHLVAAGGDLTISGALESARPVRVVAGRDLALTGTGQVSVQHQGERLDGAVPQPVSELSLLQAGRDITAAGTASAVAGITVAGPGDLVLLAGRDIDLGASRGLQSIGNQRNSTLLPATGAQLTLLAGYRAGEDLAQAAAGSYALTGVRELAALDAELYAWLGGGNAGAFEALPLAQRTEAVQALLGADWAPRLNTWLRAATAFGMAPGKAEAVSAELAAALAGDAAAQALIGRIEAAPAAEQPVLAAQALARTEVRAKLELSSWLRARLAMTLNEGTAEATLAALPVPLQQAALGGVLALTLQARPAPQQDGFVAGQLATRPADDAWHRRAAELSAYLARVAGVQATGTATLAALRALPPERQLPWLAQVLRADLSAAGAEAAAVGLGDRFDAAYAPGFLSYAALFPLAGRGDGGVGDAGAIVTPTSQIAAAQPASITLLAPSGGVNAGALVPGAVSKAASELGILTIGGGDIFAAVRDDFEVNQSRVFTLAEGDIVLWSSDGNIDAGRGAKTVTGAPPPVLRLQADGTLFLDASGSFSGSGIAALDARSAVQLYAPRGEVNAGEAGISSAGNLTIAAAQVRGADNIAAGGSTTGDTGQVSAGTTAALAGVGQAATAATASASPTDDDDERKKRRRRRNLFLDFLGFGSGDD